MDSYSKGHFTVLWLKGGGHGLDISKAGREWERSTYMLISGWCSKAALEVESVEISLLELRGGPRMD